MPQVYSLHEFYYLLVEKTFDQWLAGRLQSAGALGGMMQDLVSITQDTIDAEAQVSALIQQKVGGRKT